MYHKSTRDIRLNIYKYICIDKYIYRLYNYILNIREEKDIISDNREIIFFLFNITIFFFKKREMIEMVGITFFLFTW